MSDSFNHTSDTPQGWSEYSRILREETPNRAPEHLNRRVQHRLDRLAVGASRAVRRLALWTAVSATCATVLVTFITLPTGGRMNSEGALLAAHEATYVDPALLDRSSEREDAAHASSRLPDPILAPIEIADVQVQGYAPPSVDPIAPGSIEAGRPRAPVAARAVAGVAIDSPARVLLPTR